MAAGCAAANRTCPPTYACICSPCVSVPSEEFSVFAVSYSVLKNGTAVVASVGTCTALTECISFSQRQLALVVVVDNL